MISLIRASFVIGVCFTGFSGVVNPSDILNLNFEERTQDEFPINWYTGGEFDTITKHFKEDIESGFSVSLDSVTRHLGKHSLCIEILPGGNWGSAREDCIEYFDTLVKYFRGKTVTFKGWVKTQNVSKWAGLWWRVGEPHDCYTYKDMHESGIDGTRDWQQYSFSISISDSASSIDFGVWLNSRQGGKAWFDDLAIDTNGVLFAR